MQNLVISKQDLSKFNEVAIAIAVAEGKIVHAVSVESAMAELKDLIVSSGCATKADLILHQKIDPDYYLDKESLLRINSQLDDLGITMLVFIDALTGKQMKNIEEITEKKVVDRNLLLLEILSQRANRHEGKLEIQKAQLEYRLARLEGFQGIYKYGHGICLNNPNGRKLETDEEKIKAKLESIETDLSITVKNRFMQRSKKTNQGIPLVALTGYTNSGKSQIINKILALDPDHNSNDETVVRDKFLSTLDISLRKTRLPNGQEILLVDTVGFVSDIPDIIKDAFRSTYEEICYADFIITVYNASTNDLEPQKNVVREALNKIGAGKKRKLRIYNKSDALDVIPECEDEDEIYVSAMTGYNMDKLVELLEKNLFKKNKEVLLEIPYAKYTVFNEIRERRILEMKDIKLTANGIELNLTVDAEEFKRYEAFIK